ncbi:Plasmodium exported protein, unknown function [Plasmodium knowlesi strain H]|uniref:EMP1-trafficking protein n=3 Tax=Plasmodium knowlesi TaxID=5850 RepID=A0A5K1UP16_PLAKH|nr:Plasmodium exported protein, unknown function [Plasmodium knowlesi strain H]OTN63859.1 Uncharacterized protein PKNOH_S140219200 [Plasmodium knowlesi]CAA9990620.1 Plasmodium exported protein, unknown function [Plasmodium knowlesi strain H]SBO26043.1 Plasmodium exported protein, unknown function [Plasmodium knowlesi strain H]SBO28738.1 Plasmodium exported protein, unknown function [Plasmodium knowlesi strain H]VVS80094.1 Plasmodium exported protein, unknown function [Plasmodium knowlesi strai|eukprot:XP_002261912.1 hypothetical protein, conserved in Plasmodium species [Plasmodium knowlesi strain H]
MFLRSKDTSARGTMSYKCNMMVAEGLNKADENALRKDQPKKEGLNSIFFYSKIFACSLLIWASQCSYSHTDFSSSPNEAYTTGSLENAVFNRILASNDPRGNYPPKAHASYMGMGSHDEQHPSTSHNAPHHGAQNGGAPLELNIDIEKKLKDLKDVIWDKVENAVDWGTLSDNVKGYLEKIDSNIENKIVSEVNKANKDSNLMENPDAKTQIISTFSQNYTIITPPLLLLFLSILTSDKIKKHLANILLTSLFVAITYIFFKLKKMDDVKKKSANDHGNSKNDEGHNAKKSKDKFKGAHA